MKSILMAGTLLCSAFTAVYGEAQSISISGFSYMTKYPVDGNVTQQKTDGGKQLPYVLDGTIVPIIYSFPTGWVDLHMVFSNQTMGAISLPLLETSGIPPAGKISRVMRYYPNLKPDVCWIVGDAFDADGSALGTAWSIPFRFLAPNRWITLSSLTPLPNGLQGDLRWSSSANVPANAKMVISFSPIGREEPAHIINADDGKGLLMRWPAGLSGQYTLNVIYKTEYEAYSTMSDGFVVTFASGPQSAIAEGENSGPAPYTAVAIAKNVSGSPVRTIGHWDYDKQKCVVDAYLPDMPALPAKPVSTTALDGAPTSAE